MQVRDDRGDAELPLEAQPQVEHDADRDEEQRERAVLEELLADLRADELDALQLHRRDRSSSAPPSPSRTAARW